MRGNHRWPVKSPHKGPVTQKMFPFDDVIMKGPTSKRRLILGMIIIWVISGGGHLYFAVMLPMGLRSAVLKIIWMTSLCRSLGKGWGLLPAFGFHDYNVDKACPSTCNVAYLGILFNTRNVCLTITHDSLVEIIMILLGWAGRISAWFPGLPRQASMCFFLRSTWPDICFSSSKFSAINT